MQEVPTLFAQSMFGFNSKYQTCELSFAWPYVIQAAVTGNKKN